MKTEDLQVLFDTHPTTNEFFITSDNQAFFTQEMADSHGQKLKDRTVTPATREGLQADASFEAGDVGKEWDEANANLTPAQKSAIAKQLKAKAAEPVKQVVTEEDLVNNPDLVTQGIKVGDTIDVPAEGGTK